MKKIIMALVLVLIMVVCSACTLNLSINSDNDTQKAASEPAEVSTEIVEVPSPEKNEPQAFYGVWCSGSKNRADAEKVADTLSVKGFDAEIFVTTDWENLNPEKFYVVTAGVCKTKQNAEILLSKVKTEGYADAYIKYTGEKK